MDWLRRNWPDLLIGVALIAVIAGIIATLISGGSFFPVRDRTAETPRATTPVTSSQSPGQSSSQSQQQSSAQAAPPAAASQPPAVAVDPAAQGEESPAADQAAGGEAASQAASPPASSSVQATPREPSAAQPLPPEPAGGQQAGAAQSQGAAGGPSQSAAVQQASSPASTPAPQASSSPEAPYRVSVGAFANAENARRQLEAFQAAGYPAFMGTQGNLNIVLVGPYDTEQEARSVAARIASSNLGVPDPTVYRLQTDEPATPSQSAPAVSQTPAPQPAAQAPAGQPAETPAASPSSATRYLQVGAYASRDSSLPQRQRLEAMGFVVTDRVENGLVKLLVGPFDATELASAQARLQSAGIESFPR